MNKISFNKPHLTGKEAHYMYEAVYKQSHIAGNGYFTKKCHSFFEERYSIKKVLLTTSCSDALEMAAILLDIKLGDEVIIPSYTFVSTANAFALRGAKIIFADSCDNNPNIDADKIESLITDKTKAIVPVHYAGVSCDMDKIMELADKYNLFVVEDAAQAIDSYYKGKPLGTIGHLGTLSFHETKNIISGEGGALFINDEKFIERAEVIWEKGTNRQKFFRGEVDKYGWVDIGSSFLPSDIIAAYLYAQLESMKNIQSKRIENWNRYYEGLSSLEINGKTKLGDIPDYATNNGHMFYLVCKNINERDSLLKFLKSNNILAVFHYQSLHSSEYFKSKHDGRALKNCDRYSNTLIRLPMYYELKQSEIEYISQKIVEFYS
ncbi:MAG: dTDP-4-amino-4,6-dideoxygalactose transaminase [Candidatus Cloacimonadota bacterium]|nr:MAG: dTDP-4-amino-4,6-dideoxygalactose transaminase [Candidatus Cloacimonadota bacterium]PIE81371.1 MAG: dTDP-4-amino-4,6-dideoxygalactose transaminase [Candidatus Delongbacteria bacterium]